MFLNKCNHAAPLKECWHLDCSKIPNTHNTLDSRASFVNWHHLKWSPLQFENNGVSGLPRTRNVVCVSGAAKAVQTRSRILLMRRWPS